MHLNTSEDGPYIEALMYGPSSNVWIAAFQCMDLQYLAAIGIWT